MSTGPFRTTSGASVQLGLVLGRGGEGVVHSVDGKPDLAAKIYLPGLATERRDKVVAMVEARWHETAKFVAFPIDALFEQRSGVFAGFTMRKVDGRRPVHELYSPSSRKTAFPSATYPLLIRTVSNVARAMASIHATGCVVGDVNHSGVLVAPDATVTLIDSDSFQATHRGQTFPCKVGVPEFTPPELQGKRLDTVSRTRDHDTFGLAVLVFNTLMMGRHPFAGRYLGSGDMPMETAIAEYRFAYSARRGATQMDPPPHVPTLADLPLPVADAFERAFGPSGTGPAGRPTASDWLSILDRAEADLVRCNQSTAHHHFRSAPTCPWCRMERAYPGFVAFVPSVQPSFSGGAAIDLGRLIAAARGIADPGPAPDLSSLMPPTPDPAPSSDVSEALNSRWARWAGGVVLVLLGLLLLSVGKGAGFLGLGALGLAGVAFFQKPSGIAAIRNKATHAEINWRQAESAYRKAAGNEAFLKVKQDAETLITQLQALPTEEKRRILSLEAKRKNLQMRRHLERYPIDKVKIKGIGESRKLTLKSYGVETAADVEYNRIISIRNFGPSTANLLLGWKHSLEAKFVFDASRPVDPQDIAAVRSEIAKSQSDLVNRLGQATTLLNRTAQEALALRKTPEQHYVALWTAVRQARVDLQAV